MEAGQRSRLQEFEKITCEGQEALHHSDWRNNANNSYRVALQQLCTAIVEAFPIDFDLSKVTSCTQLPG